MSQFLKKIQYATIAGTTAALRLIDKDWSRQYLAHSLGALPGLPAKAAQLLANKMGAQNLKDPIHSRLPAMELEQVREILRAQAPELDAQLEEISPKAYTASIGQVHWARTQQGQELAIKIQYPEIAEGLEEQLKILLDSMDRMPQSKRFGLDIGAYQDALPKFFKEELDYIEEANRQEAFYNIAKSHRQIQIPKVYPQWSNSKILVQEYIDAQPLSVWLSRADADSKKVLAQAIFDFYMDGLFQHQLIHCDWQPANYGILNQNFVLFDFGSTQKLSSSTLHALWYLISLSQHSNPPLDQIFQYWVQAGFDKNKLHEIGKERLAKINSILFWWCHQKEPWEPARWDPGPALDELLGVDKWWFRTAGPPEFLWIMRSFFGLKSLLRDLNAPIELQAIQKFLPQTKASPRAIDKTFTTQDPTSSDSSADLNLIAQSLCVAVWTNDDLTVNLQLPSRSLAELEDLIPEDAAQKIIATGVDLKKIKTQALERRGAPQVLFETSLPPKRYRVWLE